MKSSVLEDTLSLCDAFRHISRVDAVCALLQEAMAHDDSSAVIILFEMLLEKDKVLAGKSLTALIMFVEQVLEECSSTRRNNSSFERIRYLKKQACSVTSRIGTILALARERSLCLSKADLAEINFLGGNYSLQTLRSSFLNIEKLQRNHSVFLSLSELTCTRCILDSVSHVLDDDEISQYNNDTEYLLNKVSAVRRVCHLLTDGSKISTEALLDVTLSSIATSIIDQTGYNAIEVLCRVGMLSSTESRFVARIVLSTIQHQVQRSSIVCNDKNYIRTKMESFVTCLSLLQDWMLLTACGKELDAVVSLAHCLAFTCDVFARSDGDIGEGIEKMRLDLQNDAWTRRLHLEKLESDRLSNDSPLKPKIYSSWYIGDGLYLPPNESFTRGFQLLQGMTAIDSAHDSALREVYQTITRSGAYSLSLRLICTILALRTSTFGDLSLIRFENLAKAFQATTKTLAGRCLGGTRAGITSPIIDSELAVVFLQHLHQNSALTDYKVCVSSALKTENFDRLKKLANIGLEVSSSKYLNGRRNRWSKRSDVSEQCSLLAVQSKWLGVFKKNKVIVDRRLFMEGHEVRTLSSNYQISILNDFVTALSQKYRAEEVLKLFNRYADEFDIPLSAINAMYVQWLLTPPTHEEQCTSKLKYSQDVRLKSNEVEKIVRPLILRIEEESKRLEVLRICIATLDKSPSTAKDYERYTLMLTLLHESLSVSPDNHEGSKKMSLQTELNNVNRRLDALAILTSVYNEERKSSRPEFSKLFRPFEESQTTALVRMCGILGSSVEEDALCFDPLKAIEPCLEDSIDSSTVASLAPLCDVLGLPSGFIHARALIVKFRKSYNEASVPSFENDVRPVVARIKSAADKAVLAEWCAKQYENHDIERHKCLDLLLQYSLQASTEVEHCLSLSPEDCTLQALVSPRRETVRRASMMKSLLSDKLRVLEVLNPLMLGKGEVLRAITAGILKELEFLYKRSPQLNPEELIDFLYQNGSAVAADAYLNPDQAISISQFRVFCSTVHKACFAISDQHSHVDCSRQARQLAQLWLFDNGGEHSSTLSFHRTKQEAPAHVEYISFPDDKSVNFAMDFSSDHFRSTGQQNCIFSHQEETSILAGMSSREVSEFSHHRAALRIAFVIAFSHEDNFKLLDGSSDKENVDWKTTTEKRSNIRHMDLRTSKVQRIGLNPDDRISALCKELLDVVFVSSSSTSSSSTSTKFETYKLPKTVTFASRHRALRVILLLCPHELLNKIIRRDRFMESTIDNDGLSNLKRCAFSLYVAKEIEETGLSLPHADLGQLCKINFASYARSTWRDCRGHHNYQVDGRQLLLLLEMTLSDTTLDSSFIQKLVDEMIRQSLSRTLLIALERLAIQHCFALLNEVATQSIHEAVFACVRFVFADIRQTFQQQLNYSNNVDNLSSVQKKVDGLMKRISFLILHLLNDDNDKDQYQLLIHDVRNACCCVKDHTEAFSALTQITTKHQLLLDQCSSLSSF